MARSLFRRLARPLLEPFRRVLYRHCLPRGEAAESFSRLTARLEESGQDLEHLRQSVSKCAIRLDGACESLAAIEESLALFRQDAQVEMARMQQERDSDLAHADRQERNINELAIRLDGARESLVAVEQSFASFQQDAQVKLTQIQLERDTDLAQVGRKEQEQAARTRLLGMNLKSEFAGVQIRVGELEKSAVFNLQAIHDLGHGMLSIASDAVPGPAGVGVVLATCDRPGQLHSALESLALQTRKPEVVVVINDGNEGVEEVVQDFKGRLNISALKTPAPRSGSSVARNVGLNALQTPLVAFLDDDNLMWPLWIERAAAVLENDEALDVIYGAQLRDSEVSATEKSWFLVPFNLDRLRKSNFIDMNQLMHRASDARFDTHMRRMVDWDYVQKVIDGLPGRIAPVDAISSMYSTRLRDRITVVDWPPDLLGVVVNRRNRLSKPMAEGGHACPCGFQGAFLPGPNGRPAANCPQCGSLEQHRFLRLLAPLFRSFWIPSSRPKVETFMIEVAPSDATKPVRDMFGTAVTVDADPLADGRMVDVIASLTDLPMPSATFDLVVVLHVLEHIADDQAAIREIARVLRPSGIAVVQVPLSEAATTDEEVLDSSQARTICCGQADHVRMYGRDFQARLDDAGLSTVSITPRESMPLETIEKYGLQADEGLVLAVRNDSSWAKARLDDLAQALRRGAF